MTLVYTRVGGAVAGLSAAFDAGWLYGASAHGLPRRHAWIVHAGRHHCGGAALWRRRASSPATSSPALPSAPSMPMPALQPARQSAARPDGDDVYILEQDPFGTWYVDRWTANAGPVRPALTAAPNADSTVDLASTSFIIELTHATRR
jgi:hypothetical protein